jgi:hypothetical protein
MKFNTALKYEVQHGVTDNIQHEVLHGVTHDIQHEVQQHTQEWCNGGAHQGPATFSILPVCLHVENQRPCGLYQDKGWNEHIYTA